jgi:colanic acid biosynthesis protein WcaH
MEHSGRLSHVDYHTAARLTQFVSLDLLIYFEGKVLLGLRKNEPAKDTFFVPGSKVYKGETLTDAVNRIAEMELGIKIDLSKIKKNGAYEHVYNNNYSDDSFGTHYVAFPIEYYLNADERSCIEDSVFNTQHCEILWLTPTELLEHPKVHIFTKYYFCESPPNKFI